MSMIDDMTKAAEDEKARWLEHQTAYLKGHVAGCEECQKDQTPMAVGANAALEMVAIFFAEDDRKPVVMTPQRACQIAQQLTKCAMAAGMTSREVFIAMLQAGV